MTDDIHVPTPVEVDHGTFDDWFAAVNRAVQAGIGLDVLDLPDQPFYDWYEDGITPKQAAILTVNNAL